MKTLKIGPPPPPPYGDGVGIECGCRDVDGKLGGGGVNFQCFHYIPIL